MRTDTQPEVAFDFRRADHGRSEGKSLLWKLRRPAVPLAKRSIRRFGELTSERRVLPNYLIIGAKRSGSTTLARNLVASEGVHGLFPEREQLKGTYFFDVNYQRGAAWYRSHFPTAAALGSDVVGEASPYYLSHPHAAQRARTLVPDARIVCLLRNPIDRAFSHYRERVKQGVEPLSTFEAALTAEPERLAGEVDRMIDDPSYVSWAHLNFGYADQSRYHTALSRWFDVWPREQVLVLRSEDMYANPQETLRQTRSFLGLTTDIPSPAGDLHHNRLPRADVSPATRRRLWTAIAPDIAQLEELLGDPPRWSEQSAPSEQEGFSHG